MKINDAEPVDYLEDKQDDEIDDIFKELVEIGSYLLISERIEKQVSETEC